MLPKIAQNLQSLLNEKHPSTILSIPNRFSVNYRPEEILFRDRPPIEAFIQVCDLETGAQFHFTEKFILGLNSKNIVEQIYSLIKIGKPVTRRLDKITKHFGIITPRHPDSLTF